MRQCGRYLFRLWAVALIAFGSGFVVASCGGELQTGSECNEGEIVGESICEDGVWVDYEGPCLDVNCSNNGACTEVDGEPACDCDDGFEADGLSCVATNGNNDPPGDPCEDINCGPNGSCVDDGTGNPACDCDIDYEADGLSCVLADPCTEYECEPNGSCELDGDGNPECDCNEGYEPQGDTCAPEDTPCDVFNCEPNGSCEVDANGNAQCDCDTGYEPSGTSCVAEPTDPCDGVNCSPGTCEDVGGSAQCNCPAGYEPSGLICVAEPDPCDGVNCSPGTCEDVGGNAQCSCPSGYESSGLSCVAVAQCQGVNDTCTVHVLPQNQSTYEVTDYGDVDLGDELDGPIVAAFALEDTNRGYLLTASSYYRINTSNFSVIASGPHSDIHPELPAGSGLAAAYTVPERHPNNEASDGNDHITFIRKPNQTTFQAFQLSYNFSAAAFEEDDNYQGWWTINWEYGDSTTIPSDDQEILAHWLDDKNERGFLQGDPSQYCDHPDTPEQGDGLPYIGVLTPQSLHYTAATHCHPFIDRQWNTSAEVFQFGNSPTTGDIGAAFWQNGNLTFFTTGYYD